MHCSSAPDPDLAAPIEGLRLVRMTERDLDQVLSIERASFSSPWRREHFEFDLRDNPWALNQVARREDEVLGYACLWRLGEELKINNIAVRGAERRRGLGGWILGCVLRDAVRCGCNVAMLEVRPSNTPAIRLYGAYGFVEVGRRKGYYRIEQEDAILMEARLVPGAV